MKRLLALILCVLVVAVLPACRRATVQPTSQPTLTPTPRSTPLPEVPTAIPFGAEDNPIHMAFPIRASAGSARARQQAADELETAILQDSGLVVVVDLVDTDAEAVAALCDSVAGTVTVAWLNGIAYAAASAQDCGEAVLQAERGGSTVEEAVLIANRDAGISGVERLANTDFCRVSVTDFYSWLMPTLILATNDMTMVAFRTVTDVEDSAALIDAVASGECDAAGVSGRDYDTLASSDIERLPGSVNVPIAILTYPPDLPLGQRTALTAAMIAIGNGTRADLLDPMLDQDGIVDVDQGDLSAMRGFLNRAGVDLTTLGS